MTRRGGFEGSDSAFSTASAQAHARDTGVFTVGQLEEALLELFPADDAEEWDRTGMLVGDALQPVAGVCVALDPTVEAIRETRALAANVLVTHHPLFLDPLVSLAPAERCGDAVGARVWEAVTAGVAVMSFHTALDVSPLAAQVLPGILGLSLEGILEAVRTAPIRGYGQICVPQPGECLTLDGLADRCQSAFQSIPRVWGPGSRRLSRIVTCTGAAGDDLALACEAGMDCVVAGEVRYHKALDAVSRGLCVIELGHDISEYPLTSILVSSIRNVGIDSESIRVLGRANNWR